MSDITIGETTSCLIAQVAKVHRYYAGTLLASLDLHPGQEFLLMHLWAEDGLPQGVLAERMQIEPPTLTRMLQRLEVLGFVQRRRDAEDARIYRVYLTDSGWSLREPVCRCWHKLEQRTLANLSLQEQLLLRRLLMQVLANLS